MNSISSTSHLASLLSLTSFVSPSVGGGITFGRTKTRLVLSDDLREAFQATVRRAREDSPELDELQAEIDALR